MVTAASTAIRNNLGNRILNPNIKQTHFICPFRQVNNERFQRTLDIPERLVGERVDKAVAALIEDASRSLIQEWISNGSLLVNATNVKASYRVQYGDRIEVDGELPQPLDWESQQDVDFAVVFEDDHVLVIDKPAGVVAHPGVGNADGTLVNGLLAHRSALASLPRAGLVHRLDKNTSGLMVVAASEVARGALVDALSERRVTRRYLGICEGILDAHRRIDMSIGRDPRNRTRQAIRVDGRDAITDLSPKTHYRAHTLLEARLHTGRTHQIRVHANAIGHPLVGDVQYGARGRLPKAPSDTLVEVIANFDRQALHAAQLEFVHPRTGKSLSFSSSLPQDMKNLLFALEEDLAIL